MRKYAKLALVSMFCFLPLISCKSNSASENSEDKSVLGSGSRAIAPFWSRAYGVAVPGDVASAFRDLNKNYAIDFANYSQPYRDKDGLRVEGVPSTWLVVYKLSESQSAYCDYQFSNDCQVVAKSKVEIKKIVDPTNEYRKGDGIFFQGKLVGISDETLCLDSQVELKKVWSIKETGETVSLSKCDLPKLVNGAPQGQVIVLKPY